MIRISQASICNCSQVKQQGMRDEDQDQEDDQDQHQDQDQDQEQDWSSFFEVATLQLVIAGR